MTGAECIRDTIEKSGAKYIFAYPGAANCPILDSLIDSKVKVILTRSEQAAAHMASGYSKATSEAGVCCATSGPGATNLITGIATAYMDSVPIVFITGQVSSELVGKDAFQEVDITGATAPFTKHNYLITSPDEIAEVIENAFYIATTGRPGPVLIDIPIDIQLSEVLPQNNKPKRIRGYKFFPKPNSLQVKKAAKLILESKRPLILVGGGSVISKAEAEVRTLAKANGIPVVSTMNGLGMMPTEDELFFGMVGGCGNKIANYAIDKADVVIALGARLGNRSFGNFALPENSQKLIHVDIDPAEIGKSVQPSIPIVGEIKLFAEAINKLLPGKEMYKPWTGELSKLKNEQSALAKEDLGYVNPKYFIKCLSKVAGNAFVATEVGQHQIWTVNNYSVSEPRTFIMSSGMGTMGYGFSAAIGARAANKKKVIAVLGDGAFQMNFAEMATMLECNLPIKIIVFNNGTLGMVRELQAMEYGGRFTCVSLDKSPDFCKLAEAYGIESCLVQTDSEVEIAISKLLEDDNKPFLLEVKVSQNETTI